MFIKTIKVPLYCIDIFRLLCGHVKLCRLGKLLYSCLGSPLSTVPARTQRISCRHTMAGLGWAGLGWDTILNTQVDGGRILVISALLLRDDTLTNVPECLTTANCMFGWIQSHSVQQYLHNIYTLP